ncbi:MAG: hypothetical protein ISS36_00135 [Candidatus Aenigmarchaeota archaeon]|nr:hypothetical protein [Candidatus Aenigmarchaeota archaeon]
MKRLDVDAIMQYLEERQKGKEKFIEDAINIDFNINHARDKIILEFLRGRNFEKAEEIADGAA